MDNGNESWLMRLPLGQRHPLLGLVAATLITLVALAVRMALQDVLPPGLPYVTFFPAVVLSAFIFGVRPGALSAFLGLLFSWYFFIPPKGFVLNTGAVLALALYLFVVIVDLILIRWMQRAQERLIAERKVSSDLAETRAMLFQELQHRVGNNLQMVGSMLALQKRALDGDAAQAIGEAAQRIALIGTMQRDLYRSDGAPTALRELVGKVCSETMAANARDDVSLTVTGDDGITLAPSRAIPASVVVSETVANALEHGLKGAGGTIAAHVAKDGDMIVITVGDNGVGLPAGFALDQSNSLGLRLACALARQVSGDYSLQRIDNRTVATLTIGPDR